MSPDFFSIPRHGKKGKDFQVSNIKNLLTLYYLCSHIGNHSSPYLSHNLFRKYVGFLACFNLNQSNRFQVDNIVPRLVLRNAEYFLQPILSLCKALVHTWAQLVLQPFYKRSAQKGQSKQHCVCIKEKQNNSSQSFLLNPLTLKLPLAHVWVSVWRSCPYLLFGT